MDNPRARVRWGNQRFWRVDECASAEAAFEFAHRLRATHGQRYAVIVERREGNRWVVLAGAPGRGHPEG